MLHQIAHNKRMSLVVVAIFMAIWLLIGFVVGLFTSSLSGAVAGAVMLAVLALLGAGYSYYFGGATVLAVSGAREADPQQYPELNHVVEALAIGAGLPKPKVYVIEDSSPNAFATGRDPQHAAVTATTGLLQMMTREELEGVIGHEMSHVRNYDVRLVLVVSTLVAMAGLLGSWLLRAAFMGGGRRSRDAGSAALVILALGLLLMLFGYLFGPLLQFALSRERESLADASGVELTRNPAGLLSALEKLAANDRPLQNWNAATAPMYIDDPLQHHEHWFNHLFDTHPPIQERIAALRRILEVRQT